jgi:predicted AAA+ superfamily ATPase
VKNLGGFSRFLQIAAIMHGQLINTSNIARESEVARTTVNGFFEILEDTLIGYRLQPFAAKIRVREARHQKFYLFDPGVVRALKQKQGQLDREEMGPLFEGFILHLIRSYMAYFKICDEVYFWQPAEAKKTEVDFLLKRGDQLCAIEVKSTVKIKNEDLKGLKAISELKNVKRKILVYMGNSNQKVSGEFEVMTLSKFNLELKQGLF